MYTRCSTCAAVVIAILILSGLTACKNTAHGAGEDIENAGEKIQEKTD